MRFYIQAKNSSVNRDVAPCDQSGFTLIEMMIVVALIAILSAIALPAYNNYINRAKIKAVQSDLVALSLNFENSYQRKLSYPAAMADVDVLKGAFAGWRPASENFSFVSTISSGYTLIATGTAGPTNGCVVSLAQDGSQSISSCDSLGLSGSWL